MFDLANGKKGKRKEKRKKKQLRGIHRIAWDQRQGIGGEGGRSRLHQTQKHPRGRRARGKEKNGERERKRS